MYESPKSTVTLHNGVKMPILGLGAWGFNDEEAEEVVRYAFEVGYRAVDTAAGYGNEAGVGNAVRSCSIPREELFVTSKVANGDQGYDSTLRAFDESMKKLKLDVLDLYLIHWPVKGKYKDTWRAMERLYEEGRIRAIGVSNFHRHHLEDLMKDAKVVPMVNQIEFHPLLIQEDLRAFCKVNRIQFEAWSPLMQGRLDLPLLKQMADKYGKSPAQIILRWDIQHDVVTIPKSSNRDRIVENTQIFDFELSDEDMEAIDELNQNHRFGPDPDNFNF